MPQSFNPERLSVGESVGGASGAGPLCADVNGLLLDPGTAEVSGADLTNGSVTSAKLAPTAAGGGLLTGLPSPTNSAISATDTILQALAKLQGQINALNGS